MRIVIIVRSMVTSILMITSSRAHSHQVEGCRAGQGCQQFADHRGPTFLKWGILFADRRDPTFLREGSLFTVPQ